MKFYGPLLNLWEGSNQGEGYLRYAKPTITNIHAKNWHSNAHVKLLNATSFDNVVNCHIKSVMKVESSDEDPKENYREKKMMHEYSSVNELFSIFRRNKPISCVKYKNGIYYVVIQNHISSLMGLFPIVLQFSKIMSTLSIHYFKVSMDLSKTDLDLIPFDKNEIVKYILLLPEINEYGYMTKDQSASYYVIDSDWNELNQYMEFMKPYSPNCKY